jgi:regulatory protein YycH of two-component signal transduction system YycFG
MSRKSDKRFSRYYRITDGGWTDGCGPFMTYFFSANNANNDLRSYTRLPINTHPVIREETPTEILTTLCPTQHVSNPRPLIMYGTVDGQVITS